MSIQSEVANMYELMRWKGASDETARAVAMVLYRELVPDSDDSTQQDAVARAIATAGSARPPVARGSQTANDRSASTLDGTAHAGCQQAATIELTATQALRAP